MHPGEGEEGMAEWHDGTADGLRELAQSQWHTRRAAELREATGRHLRGPRLASAEGSGPSSEAERERPQQQQESRQDSRDVRSPAPVRTQGL